MTTESSKASYYKLLAAGFVLLLLIGGGIAGIYMNKTHKLEAERVQREKDLNAGPMVKTAFAGFNTSLRELVLIGEARPYQTATLYAKTSGYLEKISVDKGDKVSAGQLIAYINNPEIEQQYIAALSDLENKKKMAERDKKLLAQNFIAQEQVDITQTNVDMAQANVKSLIQQQQYKSLTAPFAGTVTARYVDVGALIQNAINSQTSAQPVVTIAELSRLRIYVYVEQRDAAFLKTGYPVEITLTERPEVHVKASITRIAGELDEHTRMMLCEVDVDNKNNVIVPGSYVQVHISNPHEDKVKRIAIPSVALVIHKNKTMVATVGKDSIIHFKDVVVANNTGDKVTLTSGIDSGERVALSIGESILDGQRVRISE